MARGPGRDVALDHHGRTGPATRAGPRDHSARRRPLPGAQRQLVHHLSRHPRRHHPRRSDQSGVRDLAEGRARQPVQGAGALRGLQPQPFRSRGRRSRLRRHRHVRRPRAHAAEPRRPLPAHARGHGRSQSQRRHRCRRNRHPDECGTGHLRHGAGFLRVDRPRQEAVWCHRRSCRPTSVRRTSSIRSGCGLRSADGRWTCFIPG